MLNSDDLFNHAVKAGKNAIARKVQATPCPDHATFVQNVRWLDGESLAFDACCENHRAAVLQAIQ